MQKTAKIPNRKLPEAASNGKFAWGMIGAGLQSIITAKNFRSTVFDAAEAASKEIISYPF